MRKIQIIIGAILQYGKRLPSIVGDYAFITFLALVFLSLIITGAIFVFTTFSLKNVEPDIQVSKTEFKENIFNDIMDIWNKRSMRLEKVGEEVYENVLEIR